MSIRMTSSGLSVDTKIPIWAIVCSIFVAGGGWILIDQNKSDIAEFKGVVVELNKSVVKLNETIIRMDERSANDSKIAHKNEQRSLENEKKLVTHEIEINNLKKAITK
ncbi:hypothetical protein PP410_gp20 [Vibrio phage NF]|uniref:Uncharacterized protein n=1 Tax=Vibrio phage NF TaxID=2686202 RepID=A0A6B9J005_9CAUD|nr:hypothetical protein PP410_gp20 [Vibrio phage NF]QGZ13237.1 hypothetical protein [Vibrio phage NF]UVD32313.1 hypothetical protein [Vibrio phage vB_VaM_H2]